MQLVHGDIHDIGKNIVKVVLESYGYQVIDLGKDVPSKTILEAYHKHQPKAIGLSALMTTTVVSMEETIHLLKQEEKDVSYLCWWCCLNRRYRSRYPS